MTQSARVVAAATAAAASVGLGHVVWRSAALPIVVGVCVWRACHVARPFSGTRPCFKFPFSHPYIGTKYIVHTYIVSYSSGAHTDAHVRTAGNDKCAQMLHPQVWLHGSSLLPAHCQKGGWGRQSQPVPDSLDGTLLRVRSRSDVLVGQTTLEASLRGSKAHCVIPQRAHEKRSYLVMIANP